MSEVSFFRSMEGSKETPKTIESLREVFQKRLEEIKYSPVTVENIEYFSDEALEKLIDLHAEVMQAYSERSDQTSDSLDKQEKEHRAFEMFNLSDVDDILQGISDVQESINALKQHIEGNIFSTNNVITPPQEAHTTILPGNGQEWEGKKLFPRMLTLLYILESDFAILPEECAVVRGTVRNNMVRKEPYARVEIPSIDRVVYICDEEGNASYVFDSEQLRKFEVELEVLDDFTKEEKNQLIKGKEIIGRRLIQSPLWREKMAELLREPISWETNVKVSIGRKSEFLREKKAFLPFDQFQEEVRKSWDEYLKQAEGEKRDVKRWYDQERQHHKNWPASPYRIYKDSGWAGYPELVGKEWLPFDEFQEEVRKSWEEYFEQTEGEKRSVIHWYDEERQHHRNWPSTPDITYKDFGWVGYLKLVGREKISFLPFDQFQEEVRKSWGEYLKQAEGEKRDVQKWYRQEQTQHTNWPANPHRTYKDSGWVGYGNLVGGEFLHKENS